MRTASRCTRWTWSPWDCPQASTVAAVREAMKGHILDSAEVVALYAINPQALGSR